MPSISAVALESLLRRDNNNTSSSSGKNKGLAATQAATAAAEGKRPSPYVVPALSRPYYFSPALYATPKPAPLPDSPPVSDSPSPYLLNHKRRGPRPTPTPSQAQHPKDSEETRAEGDKQAEGTDSCTLAVGAWSGEQNAGLECKEEECVCGAEAKEQQDDDDDDDDVYDEHDDNDFFDSQESVGVASGSEAEQGGSCSHRSGFAVRSQQGAEFYDADDDFFFDGSISQPSPPFAMNIKTELNALRLNLSEEIERRRKAEEALHCMHNHWENMGKHLSQVGLSFPRMHHAENSQFDTEVAEVCQEIIVARFVSKAVERGLAQAEVETAAEAMIDSKIHEISRLQDRIQYYEAVNNEMSQRNQEVIEHARQRRMTGKARRKWMWGCITLSVTIGASLLAYSFHKPTTPNACADTLSGTTETRAK